MQESEQARVANWFVTAVRAGELALPLPGGGGTLERWSVLQTIAAQDLSFARLAEGHADALAILVELDGPSPAPGSRWGVWAAEPPGPGLTAEVRQGGWRLSGTKQYCSGARVCTHALVTARCADEVRRLFAVEIAQSGVRPRQGTWPAVGMVGSDTLDVGFDEVAAEPVGSPDEYVNRPGFAHGGIGVAACWYGGAVAIGRTLAAAAAEREVGPHALAHLGAIDVALGAAGQALDRAAAEIDGDPFDRRGKAYTSSLRVRALVAEAGSLVMDRVGRALGAGPLCHDAAHARGVADLTVYLRQHHAERAQQELGALIAKEGVPW